MSVQSNLPGGFASKRTVRFTVGTSTAGWESTDCDYLCDGKDDQVELNAAIQALPPSGGEIVILDGTYHITALIALNKDCVTLSGNGPATVLKREWSTGSVEGVLHITASNNTIQNLSVDGNKSKFSASNSHAICLIGCRENTIVGCTCLNSANSGIHIHSSLKNTVTNNLCQGNDTGIVLIASSTNNMLIGNFCTGCDGGISLNSNSGDNMIADNKCSSCNYSGIELNTSTNNTVSGNSCQLIYNGNGIELNSSNNNTITGNICTSCDDGILLSYGRSNTISGNHVHESNIGIQVFSQFGDGAESRENLIVGNTFMRGTGLAAEYTSSQYTILLAGSGSKNNLVADNLIMGKNYSAGGSGNTFVNNKYS